MSPNGQHGDPNVREGSDSGGVFWNIRRKKRLGLDPEGEMVRDRGVSDS
jgi:hypothetical protein